MKHTNSKDKQAQSLRRSSTLFLAIVFAIAFTTNTWAQEVNYQLSSHILDINTGRPAQGVTIELYQLAPDSTWHFLAQSTTDPNGRVKNFLPEAKDNRGVYKLCFLTKPYFTAQNTKTFYPFVDVVFEISDNKHYHVPIVLSPYGYSTYRGN